MAKVTKVFPIVRFGETLRAQIYSDLHRALQFRNSPAGRHAGVEIVDAISVTLVARGEEGTFSTVGPDDARGGYLRANDKGLDDDERQYVIGFGEMLARLACERRNYGDVIYGTKSDLAGEPRPEYAKPSDSPIDDYPLPDWARIHVRRLDPHGD